MGKTTDTFFGSKFQLPQNSLFQTKTFAAGRTSNIELLMLALDLVVDKILNGISVESIECFNKGCHYSMEWHGTA